MILNTHHTGFVVKDLEKHTWKLEETVENCKYQINLLTKA